MPLTAAFRRMLHALGVDRAIGYSLLSQIGNFAIRPVSLYMTLRFLTKEEQGYFYTFATLLGLQVFFDLGVGVAMQQSVSHEVGKLHWTAAGMLAGDAAAKSRLASLVRLMLRWYSALAAVFTVALVAVGGYLFSRQGGTVAWQAPWFWTVAVTVLGMLLTPAAMLITGTGKVAEWAKFGALQSVVLNVTQCLALAAGCGLFSAPLGNTLGTAALAVWLVVWWRPFLLDLYRQPRGGPVVDWWREVWPFQWKIAISWPFGYLIYQLFTPVLFHYHGPEKAAEMGISLAAANLLTAVSMTWINTKMPLFGQLIARRDWGRLDQTFWAAFHRSCAFVVLGAAAGWGVVAGLQAWGHPFGYRFLPAGLLALLLASAVINHVIFALAAYIRAHRQDPFVWSVIAMGCAMGLSTFFFGWAYGAAGMLVAYLALNMAFFIRCTAIFVRYRRKWHADDPTGGAAEAVPAAPGRSVTVL
jgi:hypothetical protein